MELNTATARRNKMIKDRNQKHMDHQNQVHEFWIDKIPLARDYGDGVCPPCPFNDDERRYNANIRKARWARQTGATKKKHAKQEQQSQAPATKTKKKHAKQEQRRLSSVNLKPDEVSSSEAKVVLPTTKHQKKRKAEAVNKSQSSAMKKKKKKHVKRGQRRPSSAKLKPDEAPSSESKVILTTTKHQKKRKAEAANKTQGLAKKKRKRAKEQQRQSALKVEPDEAPSSEANLEHWRPYELPSKLKPPSADCMQERN